MTAPRGRCDRPSPTPTDPMNTDNVSVSRLRYEALIVLSVLGWVLSFFLLGFLLGSAA